MPLRDSLIVHNDPKSVGSEAFRTLRTNLQFTSPDRQLRVILVTSAAPGEGKSTISSNLAVAFSQAGLRTLLLDCDLRKPTVHKIVGLHNSPGLTSLLVGEVKREDVVKDVGVPNLSVIPSGPVPPNPAELLGSQAMRNVLNAVREEFDMVVVDAPPIVAVTDAAVLCPLVDGVLLTVAAGEVPRELAQHARSLLENANANVLGVVLNRINPSAQKNYQYYYYYYSEVAETSDD
ncbi:MAG TPA: CpsD/CapB family tyrosine-protein kinase [Firmicutes bacterium]|jgi:protein-tyrosine kinase|nr:CpsD/CapB family tyrosine-protein kinase [Bacillota bacterium]